MTKYFIEELEFKERIENYPPFDFLLLYGIRGLHEDPLLPRRNSSFYYRLGILMPVAFYKCMEKQLRIDFEKKLGFSVPDNIYLNYPRPMSFKEEELGLVEGTISYINQEIFTDNSIFGVVIAWKSKSGRIYKFTDEDIDCNDIEIWFHEIEVKKIYKELKPLKNRKDKSTDAEDFEIEAIEDWIIKMEIEDAFNKPNYKIEIPNELLKGLDFELQISRLDVNQTIELFFKKGMEKKIDDIIKKVDRHIAAFNSKSARKGCKYGVVHNWKTNTILPLQVNYNLDMGSAGVKFMKGLLTFLSELQCLEKVHML